MASVSSQEASESVERFFRGRKTLKSFRPLYGLLWEKFNNHRCSVNILGGPGANSPQKK
jgi:hypothetical protein